MPDRQAILRLARDEDAPDLARLNQNFNGSSDPAELIAARLANPRRVETPILAEVECRVVGFACLRLTPCVLYASPCAELTELYVEPEYRRQGIGRLLVARAERLAQEAGADEMFLLAGLDNQEALAFYHALGYEDDDLALRKRFDR